MVRRRYHPFGQFSSQQALNDLGAEKFIIDLFLLELGRRRIFEAAFWEPLKFFSQ